MYSLIISVFVYFAVSTCNGIVDKTTQDYTKGDIDYEKHVSTLANNTNVCKGMDCSETSSVDIPNNSFVKKPKSGVFQKVNFVVRRMFHSKM